MGRLLGLDIGDKRVGIAISDETRTLARPLTAMVRASKKEDFARIAALCDEHQVEQIVAGLPKTLRNEEGPQAQRVRRYADALGAAINRPIEFWDERFSSIDAQERLAASGRKTRAKGEIDATAAAIILQEYLDAHRPIDPVPD
jgi:putative Holliday junction resolvase